MDPLYWTTDLRTLQRREVHWLYGLFAAFVALAIPTFYLWNLALSVRLATIWEAPSYVPTWIQNFWLLSGLMTGLLTCLAIWILAQAARCAETKRVIAAVEGGGRPRAQTLSPSLVPPPPPP